MAKSDFVNQLRSLGYHTQEPDNDKVYFEFTPKLGVNSGKKVLMGFEGIHTFPMDCPHGPHFKPIDPGWLTPTGGIHGSAFGSEWCHWSRPFSEWNRTVKDVKTYLAHINNILMTI